MWFRSCGRAFEAALCYGFMSVFTLFRQSDLGSLLVLKRTVLAMICEGWGNWTSVDEVSDVGHLGEFHMSRLPIHVNVDKRDSVFMLQRADW